LIQGLVPSGPPRAGAAVKKCEFERARKNARSPQDHSHTALQETRRSTSSVLLTRRYNEYITLTRRHLLAGIGLLSKATGESVLSVAYAGSMTSLMEGEIKQAALAQLGLSLQGCAQGLADWHNSSLVTSFVLMFSSP